MFTQYNLQREGKKLMFFVAFEKRFMFFLVNFGPFVIFFPAIT
jgi:hypothetical protein